MSKLALVSVIETPGFLATAMRIITEQERALLVDDFAYNLLAEKFDSRYGRGAQAAVGLVRARQEGR